MIVFYELVIEGKKTENEMIVSKANAAARLTVLRLQGKKCELYKIVSTDKGDTRERVG